MRLTLSPPTPLALGQFLLALLLAFCPVVRVGAAPSATFAPLSSPTAPVEENEQEEKSSTERESEAEEGTLGRSDRRVAPPALLHHVAHSLSHELSVHPATALLRSTDDDPFRNGLGCPFRC